MGAVYASVEDITALGRSLTNQQSEAADVLLEQASAKLRLFAQKYGKTPAQVILRWHTQMGFVVIPGSRNVDHIRDNMNILDFTLTDDEMAEIAKLNKGVRYYTRTDEALAGFASWRPAFEQK